VRPNRRLLASGRDSDIYAHAPGLVVRRSRQGRSLRTEALTMEYARSCGYPVPAVAELSDDETELVMEQVDGPSMVDLLGRRPWTLATQADLLISLHRRLHELLAPEWLLPAQVGTGDRLLHLDLHPLNVLMGTSGPMVIDWSNAARGDPPIDVAMSWLLMAVGEIPAGRIQAAFLERARIFLIRRFLIGFEREDVQRCLHEVVEWKMTDENMTASECAAMSVFLHKAAEPAGSRWFRSTWLSHRWS
jgi:Phosphotransferase enzyme family